jgi:tetratricopeptide (TPR) repeat protein
MNKQIVFKTIQGMDLSQSSVDDLTRLGYACLNSNDYNGAKGYFCQVLQIYNNAEAEKIDIKDQDSLDKCLFIMDKIYTYLEDNQEYVLSLHYLEISLELQFQQRQLLGGDDAMRYDIIRTKFLISKVYDKMKNHEAAIRFYLDTLGMMTAGGTNNIHPEIPPILTRISYNYMSLQKYVEALDYENRSIAMRIAIYGREDAIDIDIARSLHLKGIALNMLKRYEESIVSFNQSLQMMKFIYKDEEGGIHISIAKAQSEIGILCELRSNFPLALYYQKQSLHMRHILYNRSETPSRLIFDDIISSLTHVAIAYANHHDDEKDYNACASIEAYRLTLQIKTDDKSHKNNTNAAIGIKLYFLYTKSKNRLLRIIDKSEKKKLKIGDCCNFYCLQQSKSLQLCAKCLFARYCSPECHKRHWKAEGGHKITCSFITKFREVLLNNPNHQRDPGFIRDYIINNIEELMSSECTHNLKGP